MPVKKTTKKDRNTQKYPYHPKPNQAKWEKEIVTKKDRQEYKDYYGHEPKKGNGG